MSDKRYILNRLKSHNTDQSALLFPTEESHTAHLSLHLFFRHVRLVVAVVWYSALVSASGEVYEVINGVCVFVGKFSNHVRDCFGFSIPRNEKSTARMILFKIPEVQLQSSAVKAPY